MVPRYSPVGPPRDRWSGSEDNSEPGSAVTRTTQSAIIRPRNYPERRLTPFLPLSSPSLQSLWRSLDIPLFFPSSQHALWFNRDCEICRTERNEKARQKERGSGGRRVAVVEQKLWQEWSEKNWSASNGCGTEGRETGKGPRRWRRKGSPRQTPRVFVERYRASQTMRENLDNWRDQNGRAFPPSTCRPSPPCGTCNSRNTLSVLWARVDGKAIF